MQLTEAIVAGLGLVTLGWSQPTDAGGQSLSNGFPATFWKDTQTQSYHCVEKDIVRCPSTGSGGCPYIDFCEVHCFKHKEGAACVDMGAVIGEVPSDNEAPTRKDPVSAEDLKVAARDASLQENKHYVCSKNRRSVLICRYGFCSTDHYCKSNEECKYESVSCESKSDIPAVAYRSEAAPLKLVTRDRGSKQKSKYTCSKDRASVLKCTYGVCAIDYYCAKGHPCVGKPARCKKAVKL